MISSGQRGTHMPPSDLDSYQHWRLTGSVGADTMHPRTNSVGYNETLQHRDADLFD